MMNENNNKSRDIKIEQTINADECDVITQAFYMSEGNNSIAQEIKSCPKHSWRPKTKEASILYEEAKSIFKDRFIRMIFGLAQESELKLSDYHHKVLHSADKTKEWIKENATKSDLYPYQVYDDVAIALYKNGVTPNLNVAKPELLAGRIPCTLNNYKPFTDLGANIVKLIDGLKKQIADVEVKAEVKTEEKVERAYKVTDKVYDVDGFGRFLIRDDGLSFTDTSGRFLDFDNFIPCTIWDFREEMKADKAQAEADKNKALEELEAETAKKLETALEADKKKIEKHRAKHEKLINADYTTALRNIDNYYGKMIVKDDEKLQKTENYVDPIDINNYQGRFVQLVPDKRGLVKKSADGTFKITLAYKPNPLVIGVVDGCIGNILKVYDSGFHEVVTQGLKEVKTGDFICPSDDFRGHVKYVNKSLGAVDDIDKFRIPIGKIIGVEESENGEVEQAISSVLCKLCD